MPSRIDDYDDNNKNNNYCYCNLTSTISIISLSGGSFQFRHQRHVRLEVSGERLVLGRRERADIFLRRQRRTDRRFLREYGEPRGVDDIIIIYGRVPIAPEKSTPFVAVWRKI